MTEYICPVCGYEGRGRTTKRGSGTMEMVIYGVLLVPGPFYSMYRRLFLPRMCTQCGLKMVKTTSDAGFMAQRKFDAELGLLPVAKKAEPTPPPPITPLPERTAPKKPADPNQW